MTTPSTDAVSATASQSSAALKALAADPDVRYPAFDELRSQCPVHKVPGAPSYMAVNFDSVETGLRSVSSFGGSAGQDGLPEEDTTIAGILEPRHMQIRRIINKVVSVHQAQHIEEYLGSFIGRLASALVASIPDDGSPVEVMSSYIEPIPPAAMARLMGFPEEDSARYYQWGAELGIRFAEAVAEGRSISLRQASPQMAAYVEDRIRVRQELPESAWPNDALTRFLTTEVDGERLTERAVVTQIMFSIGAGSDTTRNTLGSLLYRLAKAPELYEHICSDRTLVEPAVEEALRLDPPAQFMVRRCLVPSFDLSGTTVHEGEPLLFSIGAANRDPAVYESPGTFDPRRSRLREHLAFGAGPHTCPGATLARTEMRIALNVWCDTIKSFSLAPDFAWEPPGTGMLHGPNRLALLLTPCSRL